MDAPTRGRRGRKPASTAPTTRQRSGSDASASTDMPPPASAPNTRRTARESEKSAESGSLTRDPVPRRGARPGPAMSVASIATDPPKPDDASDIDEEDDEVEEEERDDASGESQAQDEASVEGEEDEQEVQRQLQIFSFADLAAAADDLIKRFQNHVPKSALHKQLLKRKRDAFGSIREVYEDPDATSIFLNYAWAQDMTPSDDLELGASTAIGLANVAILLDGLDYLSTDDTLQLVQFFEQLDLYFPGVFYLNTVNQQDLALALDIRTQLFIEQFAAKKTKTNARAIIKAAFCDEGVEGDDASIFANGPFKDLADQNGDEVVELCANRVQELYQLIRAEKKPAALEIMRTKFPAEELVQSLKAWAVDVYHAKSGMMNAARDAWAALRNEPEEFHDAEEALGADLDDESDIDSQPLVRFDNLEPSQRTLFQDATSLKSLHGNMSPSSAQRGRGTQSRPSANAPADYSISTQELLAIRSPPIKSSPTSKKRHRAPSGDDDEDDDDDDVFETDTRPVDSSKRARIGARFVPVNSRRVTLPDPASYLSQQTRPTAPALSGQTAVNAGGPSSSVDVEALYTQKAAAAERARLVALAALPPQRVPWSEHDSRVLVRLVLERGARWAVIERHCQDQFEHPRNQQAYRDRARNMKVEYLIGDARLPPGFDKVALGKKEIVKVHSAGKNPFRMESEVDGSGRPVNTEYDPNAAA